MLSILLWELQEATGASWCCQNWDKTHGSASHAQAAAWIGRGRVRDASGKAQGWELLWLLPPVAVGAVPVACWAAKSESCEARCKQPLQLG